MIGKCASAKYSYWVKLVTQEYLYMTTYQKPKSLLPIFSCLAHICIDLNRSLKLKRPLTYFILTVPCFRTIHTWLRRTCKSTTTLVRSSTKSTRYAFCSLFVDLLGANRKGQAFFLLPTENYPTRQIIPPHTLI